MTHSSSPSSLRLLIAPVLILTIFSQLAFAEEAKPSPKRDLDFDYVFESRKAGGSEISRSRFETRYIVSEENGKELSISLPWSSITLDDGAGRHEASSVGDLSVDLEFPLSPKDAKRRFSLHGGLNLPTGKDSLSAEEALAVEAISPSREDWDDPALGRGFNLSVGAALLLGAEAATSWEGRFTYSYLGSFDYSTDAAQDARSHYSLEIEGDHRPGNGKAWTLGLSLESLSDEVLTSGRGPTRTVEVLNGPTDLALRLGHEVELRPNMRANVDLLWLVRGEGDYVEADGTNHVNVDLGDRFQLELKLHRRIRKDREIETGLRWRSTEASTDAAGAPIFDSKRDALSWTGSWVGKGLVGEGSLRFGLELGLNDDAPDLLLSLGALIRF